MEPGHDDVAEPPDLVVPLGQEAEHLLDGWPARPSGAPGSGGRRWPPTAASLGSFLSERPGAERTSGRVDNPYGFTVSVSSRVA